MKKVDFLKAYADETIGWERRTLLAALVSCLPSNTTVQLLDPLALDNPILRDVILRKVKRDIEAGGCRQFHKAQVKKIISLFPSLPSNKRQTCGYFLSFLYDSLTAEVQHQILEFFVTSQHVTMRNRGYKVLRRNWNSEYETTITEAWTKYQDFYCASLIVDNFPDTFLIRYLDQLDKLLIGEAGYARLWIRACERNPSLLQRIEKQDGITFAYVMFRSGKTLTPQQAFAIFNEFKFDDRISLFIWCLGRMKLWSVLEDIAGMSEKILQDKADWFRKKYGVT